MIVYVCKHRNGLTRDIGLSSAAASKQHVLGRGPLSFVAPSGLGVTDR